MAYVLANPVAAGLVQRGREWPGIWTAPEQIGAAPIVADRPTTFFRPNGYMPETAELALTVPPGFASAEDFRAQLSAALTELEADARREVESHRGGFLGRAKVLAQKPWGRPAPGEARRRLNPRVAAKDKWKRIEALGRLVGFLRAYRAAWVARREGKKDACFPAGTYLLRIAHDVPCAAL
jgi:hypothetical protein